MPRSLRPAAADDDGRAARLRRDQHGADIVHVTVGEDAGKIVARKLPYTLGFANAAR
jgi:hypothetical protein